MNAVKSLGFFIHNCYKVKVVKLEICFATHFSNVTLEKVLITLL